MRASILVLGPLLARCGHLRLSMPGGDDFHPRPVAEEIVGHGVALLRGPDRKLGEQTGSRIGSRCHV